MNLTVTAPVNGVSFGHVSYNILKELYNRGLSPSFFPIGGPDLTAFDRCGDDFKLWLNACANKAPKKFNRENPEFRLWHIQGSETSYAKDKTLLSFYELDSPTDIELNIVANQKKVYFTSEYTVGVFRNHGLPNVEYLPLGFDTENFTKIEKLESGVTTWGIMGKWEPKRKGTDRLIKLWVKKYGNNPQHKLHLHCFNGFLHQDPQQCAAINQQLVSQCLEGKTYWNISPIHGHLATLTEYNKLVNSIDIFLDMSGNEGWNLPAFHATGLGKHLVTHYANAVCGWANKENATLVESEGKVEAYDGIFFHKGAPVNQGNLFVCSDDAFSNGMDIALEKYRANPINEAGLKLKNDFKWQKTVDEVLTNL